MRCYYCEKRVKAPFWLLDNGAVLCDGCLASIGLYELLDLLRLSSFTDLLTRYGIAIRRTALGC